MIREGKDNKLAKVPAGVPAAGGSVGAFQVERCKESERIWKNLKESKHVQKISEAKQCQFYVYRQNIFFILVWTIFISVDKRKS